MKMSKYLNKRIFMCLSLALVILIVASFVASSVEDKEDVKIIEFDQKPRAKVTRDTTINFTWEITKAPSSYLADKDYYLLILPGSLEELIRGGPSKEVVNRTFEMKEELNFSGNALWEGSNKRKVGLYTSILKVPYDPTLIEFKGVEFEVVDTLLVIQKFDDINRNGKVDNKDVKVRNWTFRVIDPGRKTTTESTDDNGEIVIVVPPEYAGRVYTIEEIPQSGWHAASPSKKTVKVPIRETTLVPFLNVKNDTVLIIQKFDDTNRNGRIDGNDERLQGWEFKVTYPDGNTKPYSTSIKGEIVIKVPPEYAGKEYTVEEILQPGWKSILPSKQTVNVPAGETKTVQFLNAESRLIIQKFGDSNRNSKIDGNDAKLQGWKFKVTDPSAKHTYLVTNSKGEIIIKVPGEYAGKEYIIEETLLPLWVSVLPIEQPVHVKVPLGETETVQFLNKKNDTLLIIQKFSDSNQNNELDSEDEKFPVLGWNFNITDPAGKTSTYITNDAGEIIIVVPEKYAGQKYTVEEKLQPDWESVLPIEQPVHVKVPMGETKTIQFLNNKSITILRIRKFDDSNRNSKVDEGTDDRLEGWNFTVTDPAGKTTTNITNNRGEIIIEVPEEYVNKDYTVEEKLKDGWNAILPKKQTVKVPKGKTTTVQFLNNESDTLLIIRKFSDSNQNKDVDSTDKMLRGWEFKVTDPAGKTITHITNDQGEIVIKVPREYEGKDYIVKETLKPKWVAVLPIERRVNVPKGETTHVNFLNSGKTGNLTISKFYDLNQNRVQDPGEQGLENWNFSISPNVNDGIVTTDAKGLYRLRNIPVGRYTITEEPRSCRWSSSTETTQEVDVPAGKEAIARFGNYIAECCILPGCVWNNRDKNIEVCKSVDPCSVALGKEEEVTVYLEICVDPEHILNGTKVENISVIDTLHSQFTIVEGSFSEEPKNDPIKNPDGTTTITWDIPDLCCEEWNVSFNVTATFALPIDVTEYKRVASKVKYDDPETKVVKELSIPEGKLLFVLPTPAPSPSPTPTPEPPGFEALLAIAGLLAVAYMMWRRKK